MLMDSVSKRVEGLGKRNFGVTGRRTGRSFWWRSRAIRSDWTGEMS